MSKYTNYNDSRDAIFTELYYLMQADEDIVVLSGDTGAFMFQTYKEKFPDRFYNVGVAEQNMMSVAAGLALAGKKPVIYGISNFVTLRCFEQIKLDICSMNLKVLILGTGTGFTYSYDGITHHVTEDVALMRTLPNMVILSPSDYNSAGMLLRRAILDESGPCYLRFDKGPYKKKYDFEETFLGDCKYYAANPDKPEVNKMIVTTGITTDIALAYQEEHPEVGVLDVMRLDSIYNFTNKLEDGAEVIVLEEHSVIGGLGDAILNMCQGYKVKKIGITDFVKGIGTREELRKIAGIEL